MLLAIPDNAPLGAKETSVFFEYKNHRLKKRPSLHIGFIFFLNNIGKDIHLVPPEVCVCISFSKPYLLSITLVIFSTIVG